MYGRGHSGGMGFGPPVTPLAIKQLLIANAIVFLAQHLFPWLTLVGSVTPAAFLQHGMLYSQRAVGVNTPVTAALTRASGLP